jgi:hypothetical protein
MRQKPATGTLFSQLGFCSKSGASCESWSNVRFRH